MLSLHSKSMAQSSYPPTIIMRGATSEDVTFVAECVLAAVDRYDFRSECPQLALTEQICGREDTLYSFRNAWIATIEGTTIGCLIAYDGTEYAKAREITYGIMKRNGVDLTGTEAETGPGEFYLDTLVLRPNFRKYGIGRLMIRYAVETARSRGLDRCSLIVSKDKERLGQYYESLGFRIDKEIAAFGEPYLKMVMNI